MRAPQFGVREPGRDYPDRPAAFAIIERAGRIALVQVASARRPDPYDLPGGGIDPGEGEIAACLREVGEEAGLRVAVEAEPFARADHFFVNDVGVSCNTRGAFFAGRVLAEAPELKTEADHTLVWMEPAEALLALDRDAHAWALAAWMRRLRKRA